MSRGYQCARLGWAVFATATFLSAASAVNYSFTTIDPPEGAAYTELRGINERGDIVGFAYPASGLAYAFVIEDGVFRKLAYPGTAVNYANGINARGEIVGSNDAPYAGLCCGWVYRKGTYERLLAHGGSQTAGNGINDRGDIVGNTLYRSHGKWTEIKYPGAWASDLQGISNQGHIVGWRQLTPAHYPQGFEWESGRFTDIVLPGADATIPFGINEHGQIVGNYQRGNHVSAFLLDDGILTLMDAPAATHTYAHGINNRGEIVGSYFDANWKLHGFLARPKR